MNDSNESRAGRIILIADDDAATRLIMRSVIEQAGFSVIEAADGEEAVLRFEDSNPDLVLLDVEMPKRDGFSACEMMRSREGSRVTPICIITGLEDEKSIERAYHVGATDFISKPIGWSVLVHRIRYMLRSNEALNEIKSLVSALPDTVFTLDSEGQTSNSPAGASNEEFALADDRETVKSYVGRALSSGEPQIYEYAVPSSDTHLETRFVARDRHSVLAIVRDVSDRKRAERRIYNLAYYDRLTGLPNRLLFSQQLDTEIEWAQQNEKPFAIIFVDLDHFKRINDTLGHSLGDELLKSVALRLQSCVRSADRLVPETLDAPNVVDLARLGGDEFVIILRGVGTEDIAASIAERIISSLSEPFNCSGHQFVVTPSIGVALYPHDGETRDDLLMNADSAMYKAKAAGRNNFKFYSETMKVKSLYRLDMENELRQAIEAESFELYYQPKVDIKSWTIVGAEALLRWQHPDRGWISPADFIPVAEETGLILPLGQWVLETACRQIKAWKNQRIPRITVSVNISSEQMYADDLAANVMRAVTTTGIEPGRLELEITESLLMRDTDNTIRALKALKSFGVSISIDDFGTGYSSLSYLTRFPIDVLKIDQSFVRDLNIDNDDAAICSAILAMARNLGLKVVAEGVETDDQLSFLRRHGCDQIQGYLFSKPLPAPEFEKLLQSSKTSCDVIAVDF